MRIFVIILLVLLLVFFIIELAHGETGYGVVRKKQLIGEIRIPSKSEKFGNRICPVSGLKIKDGEEEEYEYKGKIYNFHSSLCIEEFKKNPERYIHVLKIWEKTIT